MRLILSVVFYLWAMHTLKAQPAYCQLKGPVFVETDPARAQYRVFVDDSESFADLLVFRAANALFADKGGLWYFTQSRAQAVFSILFVKERAMADFSVHYIDTESFAGCQK